MYIHSYQIHNVLNVYRKQLSDGQGSNSSKGSPEAVTKDRLTISAGGQRQSIMDKISTQIVERIVQTGPKNRFEGVLADRLVHRPQTEAPSDRPSDFKYTVIDEKNRKFTNTLTTHGVNPQDQKSESVGEAHKGNNPVSEIKSSKEPQQI